MKRIVVASDLSPCSTNALARAIKLPANDNAAIRIVHATTESEEPGTSVATSRRMIAEAQVMAKDLTGGALDITIICSGVYVFRAIPRSFQAQNSRNSNHQYGPLFGGKAIASAS